MTSRHSSSRPLGWRFAVVATSFFLAVSCENQSKPVDLPPKQSPPSSGDGGGRSKATQPSQPKGDGTAPGRSGGGTKGEPRSGAGSGSSRSSGSGGSGAANGRKGALDTGSGARSGGTDAGGNDDGSWGGSRSKATTQGKDQRGGSSASPSGRTDRGSSRAAARSGEEPRDGDGARPPKPRKAGLDGTAKPRPITGHASGSAWSIVLGTFTGPDHAAAARDANLKLAERIPEFATGTVRSTGHGSMILWGQFAGPEDPNGQKELKRIQAFEYRGARPFATALLVRPEPTRKPPTGPHDLRNLRAKFPTIDPLYTLQVAAWADFDDSQELDDIRRKAEAYTAELRARGFDAWYNHDDDLKMSVVTIGAFDRTAYDPQSTLYAPELEKLIKQFPKHLVNGEPLMLRLDPKNPKSPETAQTCPLVEVPR